MENQHDPNLFHQSDVVEVRRATNRGKGGRAVVARRDVAAGELLERVPVLLIPRTQVFGPNDIAKRAARISWYVFNWLPTKRDYVALALGYGSIYNHSDTPNAQYLLEMPDIINYVALKPIKAGEEIFIDYRGEVTSEEGLGFDVITKPLDVPDADSSNENNDS
ncbi:MAG TPA: SET domain-containing protein-lysine N-methyltransferase [Tepidisphaeraceae bacterium]|jgi:hypothetical protein